jgi:hypothetical protein
VTRPPDVVVVGAGLDFWRVEAREPEWLLRLLAEMRVPGRAWLQFKVDGKQHRSHIRQTAIIDPAGLAGLLCRYALPLHRLGVASMPDGAVREVHPRAVVDRAGRPAEVAR